MSAGRTGPQAYVPGSMMEFLSEQIKPNAPIESGRFFLPLAPGLRSFRTREFHRNSASLLIDNEHGARGVGQIFLFCAIIRRWQLDFFCSNVTGVELALTAVVNEKGEGCKRVVSRARKRERGRNTAGRKFSVISNSRFIHLYLDHCRNMGR